MVGSRKPPQLVSHQARRELIAYRAEQLAVLQRAKVAVSAALLEDESVVAGMLSIFEAADADLSGSLTLAEFAVAMATLANQALLREGGELGVEVRGEQV